VSLGDLYDDQNTLTTQQAALAAGVRALLQQLRAAHHTGRNDAVTSDSDTNAETVESLVVSLGTTVTAICAEMDASLPLRFVKVSDTCSLTDANSMVTVSPIYLDGAGSCTHGLNLNAVSDSVTLVLV